MPHNLLSQKNNARIYLGSSLLFLYILVSIISFGLLIILSIFLPFTVRYKLSTLCATSIIQATKICCGLSYRVQGLENLPKNQLFIVLSKHQSAWETLAFRLFLPKQTSLLKQSLLSIPIGGWAMATLKPISIKRTNHVSALRTLIKQGIKRLKEGFIVIIFPEGTRVAPNENKKFYSGGALLAQKTGYPVIPIAHNAGTFWPRYSFLKYPGIITVKIGPAIKSKTKTAKEINTQAQAWIDHAMNEIKSSPMQTD